LVLFLSIVKCKTKRGRRNGIEAEVIKRRCEKGRKRRLVFIGRGYKKLSKDNWSPRINEEAVTTTTIKSIGQFLGSCENQG
jgi:hypothetical protein